MWFKRSDGVLFETADGSESHRLMLRDGGFEAVPSPTEQNPENNADGQGDGQGQESDPAKALGKMTVAQLRALAQERNITLEGNLNKTQIIAFLTGFEG